jgi:hypothetical protein
MRSAWLAWWVQGSCGTPANDSAAHVTRVKLFTTPLSFLAVAVQGKSSSAGQCGTLSGQPLPPQWRAGPTSIKDRERNAEVLHHGEDVVIDVVTGLQALGSIS